MFILSWLIYGAIVGSIAKALVSFIKPESVAAYNSWTSTILIGVGGSYIGGFLNWALLGGNNLLSASGMTMGAVGAVLGLLSLHFYKTGEWQKWIKPQ